MQWNRSDFHLPGCLERLSGPLIFLQDQSLYTLQLGLSLFRWLYNVQWAYLMASSLIVTLSVIVLFFFTQRSFIEGVGFTGTKI